MKKVIVSEEQFKKLTEDLASSALVKDDVPVIDATAENSADVPSTGQAMADKVRANGGTAAKIRVTPKTATPTDNLELSGQGDNAREQFTDAVESANRSGLNKDNVSYVVTLGPDGLPTKNEGRMLSKALVENARVRNLRNKSKMFSKKSLKEGIDKSVNSMDSLLEAIRMNFSQSEYSLQSDLRDFQRTIESFNKELENQIHEVTSVLSSLGINSKPTFEFNDWSDDASEFKIVYNTGLNENDIDDDTYNDLEYLSTYGDFINVSIGSINGITVEISGEIPYIKTTGKF